MPRVSVAETGDSSGTNTKEGICSWKPLTSNGSQDVTVDASVCITVKSVVMRCIEEINKSGLKFRIYM
jgi:hypothetical protein